MLDFGFKNVVLLQPLSRDDGINSNLFKSYLNKVTFINYKEVKMAKKNQRKLIIFTGPSGVGKGTIEKALFENKDLKLKLSVL